jgi:hypothetical protein
MFHSQWKHSNDRPNFIHRPSYDGQPSTFPERSIHSSDVFPITGHLCNDLPIRSTPHERESLPSPELDIVVDMVISWIGLLDLDIHTVIEVVDMYSFQSIFLPSRKDLLEAMDEVCPLTCIPSIGLSSWKP